MDGKIILFNILQPFVFYILFAEYIAEGRALGMAADLGGEGFLFIERGIKVD